MLGRKLPSRCDRVHLGMSEAPWAHGPEGEAYGGPPLCRCVAVVGVSLLGSPHLGLLGSSAQGFTV